MHIPPDCPYLKRSEGLEKRLLAERALSDRLAEALKECEEGIKARDALVAWEEARRG